MSSRRKASTRAEAPRHHAPEGSTPSARSTRSWVRLLGADPRPWILASAEPAARWVVHDQLPIDDHSGPLAATARAEMLADAGTDALIERLTDWEVAGELSGHQSPAFAPNLLGLLADMGVTGGDDDRIDAVLDAMLRHQLPSGPFLSLFESRVTPEPAWSTLLCDTHAITEVLCRFGRGDDPRVAHGVQAMTDALADTTQGRAWPCVPDSATGFRGPGRKHDFCPQVTLEALRVWSLAPDPIPTPTTTPATAPTPAPAPAPASTPGARRPDDQLDVARVALRAWRARADEKPYMFGHGYQFKVVKWPTTWYGISAVLDTLGRYPGLWRGPTADPADRRALAELVACLVAYNFSPDGTVTPQSCYRGFAGYSFGQKKQPSPFATARLCAILDRFDDLVDDVALIDVATLASSKGGTGTPRPPKH